MASNWYDALSGGQLHVQAYEASYNVAGNYSRVQVNVWIERTSGTGKYSNYTDNSWSDAVGGSTFQHGSGTYDLRGGGSQLLLSGQITVYHNADGSRVIAISGAFTDPHGNLGSGSAGGSLTLTTIPRATQPTVSPTSGNTDANYDIDYDGAASAFTHDLYYSLDGGATYVSLATALGQTGTYTWTPASSLLPDSTDVTAIIRLDTKSGATLIGTKTVSLPLHVPDTVKPTVSSVSWADAQTSSPDLPTLMGGTGRYVQGWSKLKPTATASGASGSTITETDITQNGQVTTSGVAFGLPIALSGAVPFSATAKDSRNRSSAPLTGTVAVTAYAFPSLASLAVQRTSDAAGTLPDPTGTYLKITPTASTSDLTFGGSQKNLLEYQIRIAPKSTGVFTTVQAWTSSGVSGVTWTAARVFGTYASSDEWIVEVSIRDVFGKNGYNTGSTVRVATLNVASESVFMDWDEGKGIGLGQYRQGLGLLEVADGSGKGIYQGGHKVIDTSVVATTSAQGIVELATDAEATTGTDTTRAVTPHALAAVATPLAAGYRLLQTVYITSSTTFTKASYPTARAFRFRVQGGGGAGGGSAAASSGAHSEGSGGGAGGYAEAFVLASALSSSLTCTVGAGGVGVSGTTGGNGGNSSAGSLAVAGGGYGGTTAGNSTAVGFGVIGSAGGAATAGDIQLAGGDGGFGVGSGSFGNGGTGGNGLLGWGGAGYASPSSTGSGPGGPGSGYGGGGGGAGTNTAQGARAGGNGAPGIIIVEVYA